MCAIRPDIRYLGKSRDVCCLVVFASYAGMFGGCLRPVSDVGASETLLFGIGDKTSKLSQILVLRACLLHLLSR
jgi:hypothetical protein